MSTESIARTGVRLREIRDDCDDFSLEKTILDKALYALNMAYWQVSIEERGPDDRLKEFWGHMDELEGKNA